MNEVLVNGTVLKGAANSYTILRALGQGSFGITYLAQTQVVGPLGTINVKVALKEFFMKEINSREGSTVTGGSSRNGLFDKYRQKFRREAQNLSRMQSPGIVKVLESFDTNNTSYIAMEYLGGGSLDDLIIRNDGLDEELSLHYVRGIGQALSYMHSHQMLHLDLKPSNVMLNDMGEPILIDFGLSKQYDESGQPESSTTVGGGTPGYAPIEQSSYHEGKGFPVTIDVYALGATLFKMLTGHRPPECDEIINEGFPVDDLKGVSQTTVAAIEKAMSFRKADRYQSVDDFLAALGTPVAATPTEATTIDRGEETEVEVVHVVAIPSQQMPRKETIRVGKETFQMLYVEGGTFTMGSTVEQDPSADGDERPLHSVTVDGFYIGETQVTQSLWRSIMGYNRSSYKSDGRPVENVSWDEVQKFIDSLNRKTGRQFRLPTEAEWEFAARGGNRGRGYRFSGSDNIGEVAWYNGNSEKRTHLVKTKKPNELGLYDMSGNVWEWCGDWYDEYTPEVQLNPQGPAEGTVRVFRGGGWNDSIAGCRVTSRFCGEPTVRYDNLGFRLVLDK